MSRRKQTNKANCTNKQQTDRNDKLFRELINWFIPPGELFQRSKFHGNVKWVAEEVMAQALIWSWQETTNVTDAFDQTRKICEDLKLSRSMLTYTAFMNALTRYAERFQDRMRKQFQKLAEDVGGERFRTRGWVFIGFDGSRITAPRTESNERAFCAPNDGKGKRGEVRKEEVQRHASHTQQTESAAAAEASGLDHDDVAHEAATAVDLATGRIEFE